ncbi:MAG TPA: dTDP-4-dehydrorhamnose reductase [Rhizomicrobium sp.]|nr:dTDP-4-dehydrorhamnose reductase [Rhizomicrobium sp.]
MIFGRTGQVGRELARAHWTVGCMPLLLGRPECDLADAVAVRRAILREQPEIVINAAAYTAVDRAESEPEIAAKVNRDAPAAMAKACEETGAALIHLSTDYVFDGSKRGAYVEDDPIAPLSVYGRTKAEGEAEVGRAARRHVILRTSWVFASHGGNFVRTMLRLADERPELRIVCDQRGAPTAARDIASAIVSIVASVGEGGKSWGIFHFTSAEPATWHDFARAIFEGAGRQTKLVPVSTAEYKTAAQRPLNSVLDCGRIALDYGIRQPCWRRALADVLAELQETASIPGIASA